MAWGEVMISTPFPLSKIPNEKATRQLGVPVKLAYRKKEEKKKKKRQTLKVE